MRTEYEIECKSTAEYQQMLFDAVDALTTGTITIQDFAAIVRRADHRRRVIENENYPPRRRPWPVGDNNCLKRLAPRSWSPGLSRLRLWWCVYEGAAMLMLALFLFVVALALLCVAIAGAVLSVVLRVLTAILWVIVKILERRSEPDILIVVEQEECPRPMRDITPRRKAINAPWAKQVRTE
jgi:hypothetical protein